MDDSQQSVVDFGKIVTADAIKPTAIESNYLIDAISSYSPEMLDILYLCLAATHPQLPNSKYYDESGRTKYIPDNVIKQELEKRRISDVSFRRACKGLAQTVLDLDYIDGFGLRPVFEIIDYHHGDGLYYSWNRRAEQYVLRLEKNYSEIVCQYIYKAGRDKWAKRIIEQISRWSYQFKHGRDYAYEDLRALFGVADHEYTGIDGKKNFGRKLRTAAKTVSEVTPYKVAITAAKKDPRNPREVTHYGIRWEMQEAKETIDSPPEERLEQDAGQLRLIDAATATSPFNTEPRGMTAEQQEAYDSLINRGVSASKANDLAKKYDLKRVKRNLEIAIKQKDTSRNLAGLIISLIEQDAAGQMEIEKQEARARIEQRQLDRRQAYDDLHGTTMVKIGKTEDEKEEEKTEKKPEELTDIEVEMICKKGENAGPFLLKMKRLGLTIEDVKAGRRK